MQGTAVSGGRAADLRTAGARSAIANIGTIARKEFREVLRDGRFAGVAVVVVLLLIAALVVGGQRYAAQRDIQAIAQGDVNHQFLKQGDKNPHSGAHYGNYAFKQNGPLSFFDNGVEAYSGSLVFIEAHRQNLALSPPASDLSAITRFGDLNGAMVLQVLVPLLIIVLAFMAFAGERERGTLRQLLSIGVDRRQLLWGKALGIGAAVLMVVLPALVVGALIISFADIGQGADAFWGRLGLMAAAYLAYAAIFLFLALGVSALAPSGRAALLILIGFWALSMFIVPKAAVEFSKRAYPTYSFGEFQANMAADRTRGLDGVSPRVRLAQYQQEVFRQYGVDRVEDLPVYWTALRMQKLEDMDHEVFDHYFGGLRDGYMRQQRFQDFFGVIAPSLPLASLSMGLAGTDLVHHYRFTDAAEQHRRDMIVKVNDYLADAAAAFNARRDPNETDQLGANRIFVADEAFFATIPPFDYTPPSLAEVNGRYRMHYLMLALWLAGAVAFARFAVGRLRPDMH